MGDRGLLKCKGNREHSGKAALRLINRCIPQVPDHALRLASPNACEHGRKAHLQNTGHDTRVHRT